MNIKKEHIKKFFINGQWIKPSSNDQIDVFNPSNEEVIDSIVAGNKSDIDEAVSSAKNAFQSFSVTDINYRIKLLDRISDIFDSRAKDLAKIVSEEMGAPLWLSEVAHIPNGVVHFRKTSEVLSDYSFVYPQDDYEIHKEPIGVVGMITPWNWPFNQMCTKIASALGAGCTMILKPSEISPFSAIALTEILEEAEVPKGVFNLVHGYGPIVGAALSEHDDVDMMHFTGSTRAGIAVAQASAPSVKRVCQELGGKSANIILDDADITKAVSAGAASMFINSGQSCNAPSRMLVPASKYDEAVSAAVSVAENFKVGNPFDEHTKVGPISNQVQYEKVQRLIDIGIKEGAKLEIGGHGYPEGLDRGYYIKPTVFSNVTNDMTIAREEIFGPVLCIIKYKDDKEAIDIANDTLYGLAGYISSSNPKRANLVAKKIRAGQISINGARSTGAFGGYKSSGNGREHGKDGLEEYLETKAIFTN